MADPNKFLYSWLRDGSEMWLAGNDWLDYQLEHLYLLAERLRTAPARRLVGGHHGVRVLRQTGRHCIHVGRN